jgi:hypothetical protein
MPPFPAPPVIGGATGLPAYTMPPVAHGGPAAYGRPTQHATAYGPHTPHATAYGAPTPHATAYGRPAAQAAPPAPQAAAHDASRSPAAPSGAHAHGRPGMHGAVSAPSGAWTSVHGAAVPQQRTHGTVYGGASGQSAIDMTMPVSSPMESSGSLTGHILAQGWTDTPAARNRGNVKVAVVMLIVLTAMIGVSLLFLFTAGDAMTKMLTGLL